MSAYTFVSPCPEDHFVQRWIAYASRLTDASHEFHEAVALTMLAQACSRMSASFSGLADPLNPNLYVLLVGDSTTSRKSTAARLGMRVVENALPGVMLDGVASPEAFFEVVARQTGARCAYFDEFTQALAKILTQDRMEPLQGLWLELYDRGAASYVRVSKKKQKDELRITDAQLSILGCLTPSFFQNDAIGTSAIASGLLPRFAIVRPTTKPPRMAMATLNAESAAARSTFVRWLHSLGESDWQVTFAPEVLEYLDTEVDMRIEQDGCEMSVRIPVMAKRVALLIAAGRPEVRSTYQPMTEEDRKGLGGVAIRPLRVTLDDARGAAAIVLRWHEYANPFLQQIGESGVERLIDRAVTFMRRVIRNPPDTATPAERVLIQQGAIPRRLVLRHLHTDSRNMMDVQTTLDARGIIEILDGLSGAGKKIKLWRLSAEDREERAS